MKAPWGDSRCILCLQSAVLTEEHLIPSAIGGRLTSEFLCKPCNDQLGHKVESAAKHDPNIAAAIYRFAAQYPEQARSLADRSRLLVTSPGGSAPAVRRGDEVRVISHKLADGTLVQDSPEARRTLRKLLVKAGMGAVPLAEALKQFDAAPENEPLSFGPLSVTKWGVTGVKPDLSGPPLHDLVPIKTAYEFLAGHVGTAVYGDHPPLHAVREALRAGTPTEALVVERLTANRTEPIHGILFEGNYPHAQVQVRLFGTLAYRVHFKNIAVSGSRFAYTHRLDTNEEFLNEAAEVEAT